MGSGSDVAALREFLSFLDKAIDREWTRKASLETRSLALLSSNFVIVTLFLAVFDKLAALNNLHQGTAKAVVIAALAANTISVLLALAAVIPRTISSPKPDLLKADFSKIDGGGYGAADVLSENIKARLQENTDLVASSRWRSGCTVGAFIALALSVILMLIAAGMSVPA